MKLILETQRLLLRELTAEDYQDFFELNNDPEVVRYVGDGAFASLNAAKKFLENYDQYEKYGMGRWAVILKSSGEFTGWCGLKFQPELSETGEVDLGYRFFRKFWGLGIATESATASVDYGFNELGLKRIVGRAMERNIASIKVLEKCGMHFDRKIQFDEHPGLFFEIQNPHWKDQEYSPIDCDFYDELESLATLKTEAEIIFKNEIGVHVKTKATIKTFFTKQKAEFMELADGTILRLDKLINVNGKPVPQADNC
jgi:RimJ/RimL family protein N-acetyltransferase/transcriptional antiterminator Rof (Rho-off)